MGLSEAINCPRCRWCPSRPSARRPISNRAPTGVFAENWTCRMSAGCSIPGRNKKTAIAGSLPRPVVRVVRSSLLAAKRVAWLTASRVSRERTGHYLDTTPRLVTPVPLNLTENEENEALRDLCGLVLESRTIKFPQCFFARPPQRPCYRGWRGRERKTPHLHHKWLSPKSLSPLHGTVPRPPPNCPHTAWPVSVLTFGTSIREASSSRFSYLLLLAIRTPLMPV
jgi:hypothetical protein